MCLITVFTGTTFAVRGDCSSVQTGTSENVISQLIECRLDQVVLCNSITRLDVLATRDAAA